MIRLLIPCLLCLAASVVASAQAPIQKWIDEAIKAGGGVVTIPPGEHVLPAGLLIKDAKKLALRGLEREQCVLKLPPLAYAESTEAAVVGSTRLKVRAARGWKPGMRLHLEADGDVDSFTGKPRPYVLAVIQEVLEGEFLLKEPLRHPIAAGTVIRHEDAPNLIEIRGACETIELTNLVLDGGRVDGDPPVQGHARLCGVFASGQYGYEKGPTGPKPKDITVRDCILQNFFGRGVAFYSVANAGVERCSIRDCNDEAVDFDHFTEEAVAADNRITRCRVAFELNDAGKCQIRGNEVSDCGLGLNLWRWCRQPGLNEGNVVKSNSFRNIQGNAIQVATGTAKNRFEDNEIEGAGRNGISLSGSAQVLRGNRVRDVKLKPLVVNEGEHDIQDSASGK